MADQVNYNDGKWHGWNGGECPVHPETVVEVVGICDGAAYAVGEHQEAGRVYWDDGSDIIAFRVIKEHKEPREFWISRTNGYHIIQDWEPNRPHDFIHVREVID